MTHISLDDLDQSGDLRTLADEAGALDMDGTRRDMLKKAGAGGVAVFGIGALLSPLDAIAAAGKNQKGAYSTQGKRSIRRGGINTNDVRIANYALTLEFLEAAFYAEAVKKNYADPDINAAAKVLADHEQQHVDLLKGVLGKAAVKAPKINGTAVEGYLKDQETFLRTAAAIEPVGTAAYAGAGPYLNNLAVTKAALSIHSVEANHASFTAALLRFKGIEPDADAVPNAFNPAFSFKRVISEVTKLDLVVGPLQP